MRRSIPYEPGWTVNVDGKKTEYIEVAEALIGIKLAPGEHTVVMTYTPPGLTFGIITLIIGIVCIVFIYRYDKRNNKILIARYRSQDMAETKSKKSGNKKKK